MAFSNKWLEALRESIIGATVTQKFGNIFPGEPIDPVTGKPTHQGVDLALSGGAGSNIYAPASGKVIWAGTNLPGWAPSTVVVKILAPTGYTYTLAHLADLSKGDKSRNAVLTSTGAVGNVRVGDLVRAGDIVGHEGSTGYSTGPHLHLQITSPKGQNIDPGSTPGGVFYTLYHMLGFGAGYNPSQLYQDAPPDPTKVGDLTLPVPNNPTAPTVPPSDQGPTPTPTPGTPTTTNGALDLLNPGSWVSGLYSAAGTIAIVGIGGVLLIIGLTKLGKEGPVSVVVQPVTDAVGKVGTTAAKAAALAV